MIERVRMLHGLDADIRQALRAFRNHRIATVVMVATLAVGIGGTTAIFSVIKAVVWAPLPFPDADRLVRVATAAAPETGLAELPFSSAGYRHFADNATSFEGIGAYGASGRRWRVPLLGDGPAQEVIRTSISRSVLDVLGVEPALGQWPQAEPGGRPSGNPVAIISHGLWTSRFGSDPTVIGRTLILSTSPSAIPTEIVAVMPRYFDFPSADVDIWTLREIESETNDVGEHSLLVIGRLAPGVTVHAAEAEAESLVSGFDGIGYSPQRLTSLLSGDVSVSRLKDDVVGSARRPLGIVLGTAVFVLLIACSNTANLLLLRAESRRRERAIRTALGAPRASLVRTVIVEAVMLTLMGATLGLALAHGGAVALVGIAPVEIPRLDQVRVDAAVLLFAAGVSVGAGLFFGLLPALAAGSRRALAALRLGASGATGGRRQRRILEGLVVSQVALALVLLVGCGLLVRSYRALTQVDPGFSAERAVTFRVSPSIARYRGDFGVDYGQYYYPLLERLALIPTVESVGAVSSLPLTGVEREPGSTLGPVRIDEFPQAPGQLPPNFLTKRTAPGYFATMGIPLLEGREFVEEDYSPDYSSTAFIISASVKRQYWPNESALGKRLSWGRLSGPIVGVSADVHHESLDRPPEQIIHSAQIGRTMVLAVKTAGDPTLLVPQIRSVVAGLDPEVPVSDLATLDQIVATSVSRTSFTATLLLLAAAVSLFLGTVGIYGVVSFVTRRRFREIGVRIALGAGPQRIRLQVLSRGALLALLGIGFGLVAAIGLGSVLESLLFEVESFDLATLAGASLALIAIALLACVAPALRASRVSPATTLLETD